jgi:hypothetical protein
MTGVNQISAKWTASLTCGIIFFFLFGSRPEPASAQTASLFEGTWEGTFTQVLVPGLREKMYPPQIWRMVIRENTVSMFIRSDNGQFSEIKRGIFKISQHVTNALVYSVDSASDGSWIETESWLLIQKAPNALGVLFAGAVKNPRTSDPEILNYFTVRTGDFNRVQ